MLLIAITLHYFSARLVFFSHFDDVVLFAESPFHDHVFLLPNPSRGKVLEKLRKIFPSQNLLAAKPSFAFRL